MPHTSPTQLSPETLHSLRLFNAARRVGGGMATRISAARKAVDREIPVDAYHASLMVKMAFGYLRRELPAMFARSMAGIASRQYLRTAKTLTAKSRRFDAPVKEDWFDAVKLVDYDNLIIDAPTEQFLRQLIGPVADSLTRLIDPDRAANAVFAGISQGWDRNKISRELERLFGGAEVAARRVARSVGVHIGTMTTLTMGEELSDIIVGYEVNAVLDSATRPKHRKRDGQRYYRNPKGNQLGFDRMPQPPYECTADGSTMAYGCRCILGPLFGDSEIDDA